MKSNKIFCISIFVYLQTLSSICYPQEEIWNTSNGIEGGEIHSIVSNSKGDLFITTFGNGLYRSTNKGNSWELLQQNLLKTFNPWNIYITSKDDIFLYYNGRESINWIYKSTDNGNSWTKIDLSFHPAVDYSVFSFTENGSSQLFCSVNGAVYRSPDGGNQWENVSDSSIIKLYFSKNVFLGIGANKLYRISEDALIWTEISSFTSILASHNLNISSDSQISVNNNSIVVCIDNIIFFSKDNGVSWSEGQIADQSETDKKQSLITDITIDADGNFHLSVNTSEIDNFGYVTNYRSYIYKSADNGETWLRWNNILRNNFINVLHYDNNEQLFIGTNGGGILLLEDGICNKKNTNLWSATIEDIVFKNSQEFFCTVQRNGVFHSNDSGGNWFKTTDFFDTLNVGPIEITPEGIIYVGTQYGLFRSSNTGLLWEVVRIVNNDTNVPIDQIRINSMGTILVQSRNKVFISFNGDTWALLTDVVSGNSQVFLNDNNTIFLTGYIPGFPDAEIFKIIDFIKLSAVNNPFDNIPWLCLFNDRQQFVSDFQKLYLSTDYGNTWNLIFGNTSTSLINFFVGKGNNIFIITHDYFEPFDPKEVFYISNDLGNTWKEFFISDNLHTLKMFLDPNNILLIAPQGKGILKSRIDLTDLKEDILLSNEFKLSQNYPNPFNPLTTIKYSIPKSCLVKITVNDLLGQEISVLVNEQKDPGIHEITFDAHNLSSGIYFYTMQTDNFTTAKKFILLK